MARLEEIVSDTVGITAAKEGAKASEGMFYQDKRLGKILSGFTSGFMQVMQPNFYYDLTSSEKPDLPKSDKPIRRWLADATFATGAIALATVGGQPEIAVAAKVVYNAVSSKINRDRVSKPATSPA